MPNETTIKTALYPSGHPEKVMPWVLPVVKEVARKVPDDLYYVYAYSPKGSGEHPKGRAIDFGIKDLGTSEARPGPERRALGNWIADYVIRDYKRLNVWYVIWNGRQWSDNSGNEAAYHKWGAYHGDNPHTDHVHVSFYDNRVYTPPKEPTMPDLDPKAIERIWKHAVTPGDASKLIAKHVKLAPSYDMQTLMIGTFVRILRLEYLEQIRYTAINAKLNEIIEILNKTT